MDSDGRRSIIMDAEGGLYALKRALRADIGFFERDLMLTAGQEGAREYLSGITETEIPKEPLQAIEKMLSIYSKRGYGKFTVERFNPESKIVEIRATDTVEAWAFHARGDLQREPVCYFVAGSLAGICERVFEEGSELDITAVETDCIAQGRKQCRFVIAPTSEMHRHVPNYKRPRESASEHGLRLNEEILLKNLELQNLNLSLERQVRKKAEDLARADESYKSLVEISPDPILISNLEGELVSINESGLRMLGYDSLEDTLKSVTMSSIFEDKESGWSRVIWMIEKEGTVHQLESRAIRKDGAGIACEVTARFVDLPSGRSVEAIIKDVSERQKLRERMEETKSETAVLRDVLSHDMTKYTATALHIIEKLRRSPNLSEDDKNALEVILMDIQGEFELASAVRDYCWISLIKDDEPQARNLQSMISESVEDVKRWYPDRKVHISFERKVEPQFVTGNSLTTRLFTNVLIHIIKADPRDAVEIVTSVDNYTEGDVRYWRTRFSSHDPATPGESKQTASRKPTPEEKKIGGVDIQLFLAQTLAKVSGGKLLLEDQGNDDGMRTPVISVLLRKIDERGIANIHARAAPKKIP